MNEWQEQMLNLWRDMACELQEFIEYELRLTPSEERAYQKIMAKYINGEEE